MVARWMDSWLAGQCTIDDNQALASFNIQMFFLFFSFSLNFVVVFHFCCCCRCTMKTFSDYNNIEYMWLNMKKKEWKTHWFITNNLSLIRECIFRWKSTKNNSNNNNNNHDQKNKLWLYNSYFWLGLRKPNIMPLTLAFLI